MLIFVKNHTKKMSKSKKIDLDTLFYRNSGITKPLLRPCRHLRHEQRRAGEPC